jgi:hypothetical protein
MSDALSQALEVLDSRASVVLQATVDVSAANAKQTAASAASRALEGQNGALVAERAQPGHHRPPLLTALELLQVERIGGDQVDLTEQAGLLGELAGALPFLLVFGRRGCGKLRIATPSNSRPA